MTRVTGSRAAESVPVVRMEACPNDIDANTRHNTAVFRECMAPPSNESARHISPERHGQNEWRACPCASGPPGFRHRAWYLEPWMHNVTDEMAGRSVKHRRGTNGQQSVSVLPITGHESLIASGRPDP